MQTPPQQPFVPPRGFSSPPQRSGLPVWAWMVIGAAVAGAFGFMIFAFIGFAGLGRASESLANNPNEKVTNSRTQAASDLPAGWTRAVADNVSIALAPGWQTFDL